MSEDEQFIVDYSIPLSGYIEDFPEHLYDARFREIVSVGLEEYTNRIYNYYRGKYPYEPSIIQNLRLLISKLKDTIEKISNIRGEPNLKEFLKEMLDGLSNELNELVKKYQSPEPSEYEKQYEERKKKGSYYYPYPKYPKKTRTEYTKTGLSVEESTRDEILKILEAEPGTYPNDSIVKPELWNYTLEKLRQKYLEYKAKNSELEANREKWEKEEHPFTLSKDNDTKKNLLELLREKGKIPVKKED